MKLAVVGSREFPDEEMVKLWVLENHSKFTHLISGGAGGPDRWAEQAWRSVRGEEGLIIIPADWDRYKKAAGFVRNVRIVRDADFIVVFWSKLSSGSLDDIGLAIGSEKPMNFYSR